MSKLIPLLALAPATLLSAQPPLPQPVPPWRDLNHNGRLDPYEDVRLSAEQRVDNLLEHMTVEEKAGTLLHGTLPIPRTERGSSSSGYDLAAAEQLILDSSVTSFLTRLAASPGAFAEANNAIQKLAERSRLGIPVTISSDPRHHFQAVFGASSIGGGFSQWPEPLGLGAIGDPVLVRRFGEIVAREYRAVGIHMALSPQADLFSEPRWSRGTGTFGSDPDLVSLLTGAYIEGLQGSSKGPVQGSVAAVVKHWVGYGAQPSGFDAHSYYGRKAQLDQASFASHVTAFDGAFRVHVAGVMPTYAVIEGPQLEGRPLEAVGAGFNGQLLGHLLRDKKGFRGLVLSDWAITEDCGPTCREPTIAAPQRPNAIAMPWGVEELAREDRFAKGINAGIDQFGGVADPAPLLAAIRNRTVAVSRVEEAARRILLLKFRLGLFDNPFVDPSKATLTLNDRLTHSEADAAQRLSQVILQNRGDVLPLRRGTRVWLSGISAATAEAGGLVPVDAPNAADVAIVRSATPFETLHPYHFFGARQHEGRLDLRAGDKGYDDVQRAAATPVRTILAIDMDRPAILAEVMPLADGIVALFGASDQALIDVLTGSALARGKLPIELPASMSAVEAQSPARPDDTAEPLYRRGAGMILEDSD